MTPGSSSEFSIAGSVASIAEKEAGSLGDGDDDDDHQKQEWSSPVEFLLSCVAMSVGLGSKSVLSSVR